MLHHKARWGSTLQLELADTALFPFNPHRILDFAPMQDFH
jgi:hypothetical protein